MQITPKTPVDRVAAARDKAAQREHERKAVAEHYEHQPEIFSKFLDRRLAYATGVFEHDDEDLQTAQDRKFARFRDWLAIAPGDKVLDVGCGWGSNLLYLAQHTQGQFHGITLSQEQRRIALDRAEQWGVTDRVQIDLCHVEELDLPPESVDCMIFSGSIVHMHNRPAVHQMVGRLLKPGGRLLISDCYFPANVRGDRESSATQYIFVTALGYCRLIHLSEELAMIEQAGLDLTELRDMTHSYVLTLDRWIDNIRANRRDIDAMSPGFARLCQTYMTIAKLSFERRTALEYMILATKPVRRGGSAPRAAGQPDQSGQGG